MASHRRGRWATALVIVLVVAAGCGGGGDEETVATTTTAASTSTSTTTTTIPAGPVAPFTGLPVEDEAVLDRPAIVVKISNNDQDSLDALIGLEQADLVVEERIEDRATRFAAVFHTELPSVLGPVRSGRPADIDILANLGNPLLVFSGAHISVIGQLREFANEGGTVLVVDDGSGIDLVRDGNYRRPDNLFVDLPVLLEKYGERAGAATAAFDHVSADVSRPSAPFPGDGVTVTGRDTVSFVFDPDRGYVRVQDGAVHVTREGTPLIADNLVVMEVPYTPSAYDARNVDADTVGSGPVHVLIGGRHWAGTWEREQPGDPYRFTDPDGAPIPLDPGFTWITLVPRDTYEFDVDDETAGLVLGDAG